jgi:hypothetical protein
MGELTFLMDEPAFLWRENLVCAPLSHAHGLMERKAPYKYYFLCIKMIFVQSNQFFYNCTNIAVQIAF